MTIESARQAFPQKLKYYMEITGKKQTDIATFLNVSQATVSEWLKGKKLPRMDKVQRLADLFGVTLDDLVSSEKKEAPYFINEKTSQIAQEIYDNPDLGILFDTARGATPDDLKAVIEILKRMKK